MTVGSPVVKTGEDGEFIAQFGDWVKGFWDFVIAAPNLGKKGVLMSS